MQPPQGPPGYGPHQPYTPPPYGAPPPPGGPPKASGASGLLLPGGIGCGFAVLLLLLGFVLVGVGATNRKLREAKPVGALVILFAGVPGFIGGALVVAGLVSKR